MPSCTWTRNEFAAKLSDAEAAVMSGENSRTAARRSDQHQEFAGRGGNALRSGHPPARWVRCGARRAAGRAPAQRRRDRARRDQHAGTADGVGDRQSFVRPHQQPVGSRTHAGRFEWRRSSGDRGGDVGGRRGQRRRRLDSRARTFQRHLRTEAHAGAHSGDRTLSRVRRTVCADRRGRSDGAHRGRCEGFVRSDARSGRWRYLRRAGAAALAERRRNQEAAHRLFRRRRPHAGHSGNSRSRAHRAQKPCGALDFRSSRFVPKVSKKRACCGRNSSSPPAEC